MGKFKYLIPAISGAIITSSSLVTGLASCTCAQADEILLLKEDWPGLGGLGFGIYYKYTNEVKDGQEFHLQVDLNDFSFLTPELIPQISTFGFLMLDSISLSPRGHMFNFYDEGIKFTIDGIDITDQLQEYAHPVSPEVPWESFEIYWGKDTDHPTPSMLTYQSKIDVTFKFKEAYGLNTSNNKRVTGPIYFCFCFR